MIGKTAVIPFTQIERTGVYINTKRKTLPQIMTETGADYGVNAVIYNPDFTAAEWLISDGVVYGKPQWTVYGYCLDEPIPRLAISSTAFKNFIPATPLIVKDGKSNNITPPPGMSGERGRTAIGITKDSLILRCVPDVAGTSDYSLSELAADMIGLGCISAGNMDGGESSQCIFPDGSITSDREVHSYFLVWLKKEKNTVDVKTYSLKNDGFIKLSKNSKVHEFACKDGTDEIKISEELVALLQKIRDHFGKSVTINSGYRTEAYNKKVGGAPKSQHLLGTAADIAISGAKPLEVAKFAEAAGAGGVGLYGSFTHVDVRKSPAKWDSTSGKEKAVASFLTLYKVTASKLNVRSEQRIAPETKLGSLTAGNTAKVDAVVNGWARIAYGGGWAWAKAEYLKKA